MYQEKIEIAAEPRAQIDMHVRFYSTLIIPCLPLIGLGLLARFFWNDVEAIGRGIATFCRAAAEELSRQ